MALLKNVYISSQDYWSVPSFWRTWSLTQCVCTRQLSSSLRISDSMLLISWQSRDDRILPTLRCSLGSFKIMYGLFVSPHPKKKQKRNWPNTNEQTIYWMQDALYTTFVNKPQFHNSRSCNEFELYSIFYPDCVLENLDSLNDGTTRRNWRETDTGV